MEIKYTDDGKKVAIVGKLNSQETIVQEIFFINGNEIPSGENFVVKSLHDAPAISWKEKQLKELEGRYEKEYKEWQKKIEKQDCAMRNKYNTLYEMTKSLQGMASDLHANSRLDFMRLLDFLSGNIEWVLIDNGYSGISIIPFADLPMVGISNGRVGGIKMVTLFGDPECGLAYKLDEYSRGSYEGYQIYPFYTREEAMEKAKELFSQRKSVNEHVIENANALGIELDRVKVEKYYNDRISSLSDTIEKRKSEIEGYEGEIESCKSLLNN